MKRYRNRKVQTRLMETYGQLLAAWNTEVVERDIPTAYGSTHVVVCGDPGKPPLVLFHGVGDDSALMWLYNAGALSRHFTLYALDTLGGPGKSIPNERCNRQFDIVQWINETLDGLAVNTVYAAGVSHGAYLAQLYGLHRPDRVLKMICMAGSVPVGNSGPTKTMMKVFLPEALLPTRRNTVKLLRKLSGEHADVFTGNPLILSHYHDLLRGFNPGSMRFHTLERFDNGQIEAIREKTLFLIGEDDPFARLGGKEALMRYHMNMKTFPGVGHGINHEIAAEINREIIGFLLPDHEPVG